MGLKKGPYVWSADAVNEFFTLKKSTPGKYLRSRSSSVLDSLNANPLEILRQEREIAEPANTDVSVNLPGPGKAGAYSLLISFGMAFARIFEAFFIVAFQVIGKLTLLGGSLFLITLALRLWGWL